MLSLPAQILGIFSSLGAAATWGAGDFAGGFATRRNHAFFVLAITASTGMAFMVLVTLLTNEPALNRADAAWAAAAGIFGGLGLVTLYQGLALGSAAVVSPIAGVVGAVVPVIAGAFLEGLPSPVQLAGFFLGFVSIWMVTRSSSASDKDISRKATDKRRASTLPIALAFTAGIGFGMFFVLIAQVSPEAAFAPLAISKATQAASGLGLVLLLRIRMSDRRGVLPALISGTLDVVANAFFLFATKLTRLDIASVLASLYPMGTVLLSRWILKENITAAQWLGVTLSLGAIALITI